MFKGFSPWQIRIAIVGSVGLVLLFIGALGLGHLLMTVGTSLTLLSILMLIMLGNRQSWRQLNRVHKQLEKKNTQPHQSTQPSPEAKATSLPNIGEPFEYADRIGRNPSQFESFALLSRSVKIRDAFALAATDYKYKHADLLNLVAANEIQISPVKRSDVKYWDQRVLLALARLLANQRATESDLEDAVRVFNFVRTMFGTKALSHTDRLISLEALGELQKTDEQHELIEHFNTGKAWPLQVRLLRLNNLTAGSSPVTKNWTQQFNQIYLEAGFAPVEFNSDVLARPIDRIRTLSSPIQDGPLVSVIIPTYQGGRRLLTTLECLLQQSWKNLEIIVVDDASGSAYDDYLRLASELSGKIRVLRQDQNLGVYCARNAGVAIATGEFITVHDDDDWSHGDKIATQVRHLVNNPELPGNLSTHTRVTEDLKFVRINRSPAFIRDNFSSLMVRRQIFEELGMWDTVNRGADSEFIDRINQYSQTPVATLSPVPLSLTRVREGSLTAGELERGYLDPARSLYAKAYSQWHEIAGKKPDLLKPTQPRHYPVPTTMEPGRRRSDLGPFDIVFMTDYRFPGGTTSLTLAELEESASAGYRVGFIHAESPLNGSDAPIAPRLLEMQLRGIVKQISLQDVADTRLLVIRHPSVVTFMDRAISNVRAAKAVLIVNNPPLLSDGTGMVFDLRSCIHNADRLFSTRTIVVAESGVTKALSKELVPKNRLSNSVWPGLIQAGKSTSSDFSRLPVVGRHSRDHHLKWPSTVADFHEVYTSSHYETHILGGAESLTEKLGGDVLAGKTIFNFGELDVEEFLSTLDFWVYFHDSRLTESFGMSIAEAMAAGKVVILPPYLEASFKQGALYARPEEVESLIVEIWSDPDRYRHQAELAKSYVSENFSRDAFMNRIQGLLDQETTSLGTW